MNTGDDLRARTVALEHRLNDFKSRVVAVEKWQHDQSIANAVRDERWSATLTRLEKIDTNISRVVWLVITGLVVAFMGFVVGGGLNIK